MEAGKLRHRVKIQRPIETQNPDTGAINTLNWEDVATVWAEIAPVSGRELIESSAEASRVTTRIKVRYNRLFTAKMRVYHAYKGIYYNIEAVLSDVKSGIEYLTLHCSEGVRYQEGDPDAVLPVNVNLPVLTGPAVVGSTVSVTTGDWANEPVSYTYQWYLDDLAITGASSDTLVVPNEVDGILNVGVAASNPAGDGLEVFSNSLLITA